jgi:hypothetical protein
MLASVMYFCTSREQGGQAYTFDDLPGLDVFFSKTECG